MFTQKKEISPEAMADARKLCQIKQDIQPAQWQLLRMIFTAYMDGIGMGLQLSDEDGREKLEGGVKQVGCKTNRKHGE